MKVFVWEKKNYKTRKRRKTQLNSGVERKERKKKQKKI